MNTLKGLITLTLLLALLTACSQQVLAPGEKLEPQVITTYQGSSENFPNPERGWFQSVNVGLYPTPPITTANLKTWRAEGVTLVRKYYLLKDFVNAPVSTSFLNSLKADLALIRAEGFKLVPRFVYVVDPESGTYPTNALDPNQKYSPDASLERIKQHLGQVKTILKANADVIAYMEAGFVGYWGEWHDSSNVHVDNWTLELKDSGKAIIQEILATLPKSRMVALRYPYWHNMKLYPQPLTASQAYTQSDQARLGHHDDGFCSEEDGWYYAYDSSTPVSQQKSYTGQNTRFVVMTGETGGWFGDDSYSALCNPLTLISELHYSSLNRNATDSGEKFYNNWKAKGWYDDLSRRLGYRFRLTQSNIPLQVKPGNTFRMTFTINNNGVAALYNQRPLEINLQNKTTGQVYTLRLPGTRSLNQDPRFWEGGKTYTVSVTGGIPATLPEGEYEVGLVLPDASSKLYNRAEYAIRLANQNVWQGNGVNSFLHTIKITQSATGTVYTGPNWFK